MFTVYSVQIITLISEYFSLIYVSRFLNLRGPLSAVLAMDEWSGKVDVRFRHNDWDIMTKIVSVLQVY